MKLEKKLHFTWWTTYEKYIRSVVLQQGNTGLKNISYWRNEVFLKILIYLAPLSIIALIPGISVAFLRQMPIIACADLLAFLLLIVIMTSRSLSMQGRKLIFISVFYILSIVHIYYLGKAGSGLLFLLALTILSSVICSPSIGYYSAWINTIICFCSGALSYFGINMPVTNDYTIGTWVAITSNLVLLSFVCARCLDLLIRRLTISLLENKNSKIKLEKANRLYQFISHINQSIVHLKDEKKLFRAICDIAFKIGEFKMAWIGKFDVTNTKIILIDQNGIPAKDIFLFSTSYENSGPQGHVLRTGSYYICNDIENAPELKNWNSFVKRQGIRSCIVLPIIREGEIIGTLNLYAAEVNFFDEEEVRLLSGAISDLSFILDVFENEKRHKVTAELIVNNENRFRSLIEKSTDMKMLTNLQGEFIYASPSVIKQFGYSMNEFLHKSAISFFHPDDINNLIENKEKIMEVPGKSFTFQYRFLHKNGTWIWCEGTLTNMLHEPGIHAFVSNFKNISERKLAEQKLIAISDDLQRALNDSQKVMNSSLDLICTIDGEGKFVKVSAASEGILGYKPGELSGKKYIDLVWPEDVEKTAQTAVGIMAGKAVSFFENRYIHKNGNVIPIVWSATWDDNDKMMYCIAKDVTERKKIESQLNTSETFNNGILRDITIANRKLIYQNDEKGKRAAELVVANEELVYQNEEKEKRAAELIIANKELIYQNDEKEKRAAELVVANEELVYQNKEKEKRAAELIIANKELTYQNKEKEKRAAEVIEANKQLVKAKKQKEFARNNLKALINNTNDLMWSVDREFKLITSNEPFNEMLQLVSGKRVSGKSNAFSMATYPEKFRRYEGYYKRAFAGESFTEIEPVGVPIKSWSEISFHPILKGNEIIGTACHSHDITERKKQDEERSKMSTDIVQRSKNLEQFAYIISHNLRAPVAHILGISRILKGTLSHADRIRSQDYLYTAVEKMDEIIIDLNKILTIKSEIMENREPVNLLQLVTDIKSGIEHLIEKENVQIITDFELVNEVKTLKSYVHSIFYNLISNSIKYKQNGKPPIIKIKSDTREGRIRISFKDNGTGLDLHKHGENLFGLYKRFHDNIEGKGIGLFMIKTQLEALGGSISVKSEQDMGAEFIIELPVS